MFSTDALTWHLAFRHHLRPESCESETGFSHVAWVKVGFNIAGGQLRSFKKAVSYKKDLLGKPFAGILRSAMQVQIILWIRPARLAILILLPHWLE